MTLANTNNTELSRIDGLAMEARALRTSIDLNMWQLARVFTEAKELVPHGEWGNWLKENANVSVRTAQDMVAAYKRFGSDPRFENIGKSAAFKLLPLPVEAEEQFMREHDVSAMSTREIEEAVKKVRQEMQGKIEAEQEARRDAEQCAANANAEIAALKKARDELEGIRQRLLDRTNALTDEKNRELEHKGREIEDLRNQLDLAINDAELLRKRAEEAEASAQEATRAAIDGAKDVSIQRNEIEAEKAKLRREINEKDEMIRTMQAQYDALQSDLLDAKSSIARGDAGRTDEDILSATAVNDAVRAFIGQVGRVPFMHATFATMDAEERERYRACILQVFEWAEKSMGAIEAVTTEGGVF